MKLPRLLPSIVLALAAAAASYVAWREHVQLEALRSEGVTPGERARLQKAVWAAEARARRLENQLETARSAPAAAADAAGRSLSESGVLGNAAAEYLGRMEDPEIRRLLDLIRMAGINRQNAAFYREARLAPAQLQRFQQLLLDRQNVANDVLLSAAGQGIDPMEDPAEFRQMVQNAQADIDDQIKSLLGADTYAQYQAFQQGQGQRAVVNQLQADLSYTDAPLSAAQQTQMAQVLAQANPSGGAAINDQTLSLAQGVLSAPQMQALRNLQDVQQAGQQLRSLMMQRRAGP